ncbi:hypothetical protein J6590_089768, partial [Homalodisca vitripennis]
ARRKLLTILPSRRNFDLPFVLNTAEEVCGSRKKRNKKPWVDQECEQPLKDRVKRKITWMNSNRVEYRESYNEANREANKLLRRKKDCICIDCLTRLRKIIQQITQRTSAGK